MTDFVVSAVQDAAHRAVTRADVLRLSATDQECFAQALLAPAKPNAALKTAFARHRELIRR